MTKKRKLHELKGTINYCWAGISKAKLWKKQPFYCLTITQQTLFEKRKAEIFVFPNLVSPEIWNTLEQQTFSGQTYLFYCEKRVRGWRLKEWTEIKE